MVIDIDNIITNIILTDVYIYKIQLRNKVINKAYSGEAKFD